jgi:hypothetical protein
MTQNPESDSSFPLGTASNAVKRKALWLGALWLIGGSALMFCINPLLLKRRFAAFNQAHINAPIEGIALADHGFAVQFRVKGSTYIFYPTTEAGKRASSNFAKAARVGDFVKKESKSDTLYLLKNKAVFRKILFEHF